MQWRAIGRLSGIPFGTLHTLSARWTRLGRWRRLLDRLRRTWRVACGDTAEPSAVVIDSRICRSAPSCFARGIDGGKKLRGVKVHIADEKYGIPLAIDASPTNVHDTKGIVPVLRQLAGRGSQGPAIGDLGYRGERLAKAGATLGIAIQPIARGRNGVFIPTEIAWVVERSFGWSARCRRLNVIVERTKTHLIALVEIAFVSILSRRLRRLLPRTAATCHAHRLPAGLAEAGNGQRIALVRVARSLQQVHHQRPRVLTRPARISVTGSTSRCTGTARRTAGSTHGIPAECRVRHDAGLSRRAPHAAGGTADVDCHAASPRSTYGSSAIPMTIR